MTGIARQFCLILKYNNEIKIISRLGYYNVCLQKNDTLGISTMLHSKEQQDIINNIGVANIYQKITNTSPMLVVIKIFLMR